MRCIALLLLAAMSLAIEVPASVKRVTDGDTIMVSLVDGSVLTVRLLYIDTPEPKDNAHGKGMPEGKAATVFLSELLPVGSAVILWGPGDVLELDRYKRALAVVITTPDDQGQTLVVQSAVIRMGWSVVWEKFGRADPRWRPELVKAEQEARADGAGAWTSAPDWMRDKANETTARRTTKAEPTPAIENGHQTSAEAGPANEAGANQSTPSLLPVVVICVALGIIVWIVYVSIGGLGRRRIVPTAPPASKTQKGART